MIDDEMNKPKGSACIRTWMEMKPTTFTLFTCLFFFLSLGSNSLNARVAEQDASKATTKTLIPLPQANPVVDANLTKQQSPPSDSTVLAETKKLLPRLSLDEAVIFLFLPTRWNQRAEIVAWSNWRRPLDLLVEVGSRFS